MQNLAQIAGDRVAALEEALSARMTTLTERIDVLASRLDRAGIGDAPGQTPASPS